MAFQSNLCEEVWAPFATSVTTTTVSAILCIITVPGNLLICWAVIRNPTRNLRTPFNYLVLNLAIADLIVGAVTEPVFVGYHANEALKRPVLGIRWVVYTSYFMTSTASVLSIMALAINRYQAATSNRIVKRKTSSAVATSAALWICSLSLPLLYLTFSFYLLAFIFANTAVVISIGVLMFVNYRIYHSLQEHEKISEHVRSSRDRQKHMKREKKVTISLLLIIISFLACALPSLVMIYVINLCSTCNCVLIHWFRDLQYLFLLLNSATNQFLYAWRMRSFRAAFRTIPAIQWLTRPFTGKNLIRRVRRRTAYQEQQSDRWITRVSWNSLQFARTGRDKQRSPQNKLIRLHLSLHQIKLQLGQPHKLPHLIHGAGTRPAFYLSILVTELSSPNTFLHATWWLVRVWRKLFHNMQWCEFQEYKFICDVTVLCRLMIKPILNSVKNESLL